MINVLSLSKEKVSQVEGMNSSIVSFESDEDIWGWKIKRNGISHDTGILIDEFKLDVAYFGSETVGNLGSRTVGEMSKIDSGVDIMSEIFSSDLDLGSNRLNVYGIDMNDNWDSYTE